ncbi:hypothetical protein L6452_37912 [Arctium lappa]|uniref:Uncharacterized protein n=1 Tax=Arctium lappa TaxID=4217 RepID=A0ACB8Y5S6_ARCLA|nr:hypothetical protein L6452_37912 [Arctium lappa]
MDKVLNRSPTLILAIRLSVLRNVPATSGPKKNRYLWMDLSAGPVDYGPATLSGDGVLPRDEGFVLLHMVLHRLHKGTSCSSRYRDHGFLLPDEVFELQIVEYEAHIKIPYEEQQFEALNEILSFLSNYKDAEDEALDLLLDELQHQSCKGNSSNVPLKNVAPILSQTSSKSAYLMGGMVDSLPKSDSFHKTPFPLSSTICVLLQCVCFSFYNQFKDMQGGLRAFISHGSIVKNAVLQHVRLVNPLVRPLTRYESTSAARIEEHGFESTTISDVLKGKGKGADGSWLWCTTDDSVYDAVQSMTQHNVGALVVVKPGEQSSIAGIITERDYLRKIIVQGRSSKSTKVGDIMTEENKLITVTPDTKVLKAMQLMTDNRIRHIPVIDEKKMLGMVSIGDVVRAVVSEHREELDRLNAFIQGGY